MTSVGSLNSSTYTFESGLGSIVGLLVGSTLGLTGTAWTCRNGTSAIALVQEQELAESAAA